MKQPYIDIPLPSGFVHTFTDCKEATLHAIEGGSGDTLLLLGGWPQTCYVWRLVIEKLSQHFRVIALDMRGQGDSDIVDGAYDCGTAAKEIIEFLDLKEIDQFYLVGHDVGSWVAFTILKLFANRVKGAGLIDAAVPGLVSPNFFSLPNAAKVWQFFFHKDANLSDKLVAGKEKEYMSWYFTNKSINKTNLGESVIDYYVKYYSRKNAMRAGFLWYSFVEESSVINNLSADIRFTQPIFTMGGQFATKSLIYDGLSPYCDNITGYIVENCGHYIPEESPDSIIEAILKTFN